MSCIGFTNPTQRVQIASKEACESKLPFSVPSIFGKRQQKRLEAQALSTDARVRAVAANHPRLPEFDMFMLAADKVAAVRAAVARNSSCPRWVLENLRFDQDMGIRAYAKWRLDRFEAPVLQ